MKKNMIIVAALILIYGCSDSFLDKPALGALDEAVLANEKGLNGLLIGAYSQMNGSPAALWFSSPSNFLFGSIAGGDAHKGADGGSEVAMDAFMKMTIDPTNGYIAVAWNYYYEGVARANSALRVAEMTDIPEEELNNIKGQARFIRGHFYFYLKKMFNNIPWIDENTTNYNQSNLIDTWPMIEDDFKFAMENLPNTQTDIGRANKWAAASYLAKAYLYQNKYTEAKNIFDQIISQGVTSNGLKYGLTARYDDNFNAATENNKESVFAIQMIAHDGTNDILNANVGDMLNFPYGGPFSCCGIFQPSQDLVNSFRTDPGTGLPFIDDYNTHYISHDQGLESSDPFTPDEGTIDPRLDWTVGRRGIPYLDWGNHPGKEWIRDQNYAGPYSPKKNVYRQATQDQYAAFYSWAPGTAINLNVIRFADVLLMAAEAEAELGNLSQAEQYVNMVRQRSANPEGFVKTYINENDPLAGFTDVPAANYFIAAYPDGTFSARGKEFALKAIYFERKLELGMEGHRYFDLSRWNIAEETLNNYYQYEQAITNDLTGAHFTGNKNEYYPIPQSQIDLSVSNGEQILIQNIGYQ